MKDILQSIEAKVTKLESVVREHDARTGSYANQLTSSAERQERTAEGIERAVDRLSEHLGRIELLLSKLVNGGGNRLVWFLAGAVVLAALGDRALEFLISRATGGR